MAARSDGFRNVRFAMPEERKEGLCSRLRRIFRGRREEGEKEAPAKACPEPFIICEPEVAACKGVLGPEAEGLLALLPNADIGKRARDALAAAAERAGRGLSADEAREALLGDGNAGEVAARRGELLQLAFGKKKFFYEGRQVFSGKEMVNTSYFCMAHYIRMAGAMGMPPDGKESEPVRAKAGDREKVLVKLEEALGKFRAGERLDAFMLFSDIAVGMRKALCSKEVCERIVKCCENLEAEEGRMGALRDIADFVRRGGARPSGRSMRSGIPRAEEERINEWLGKRPEGVRKVAKAAMERGKPEGMNGFMVALETDPEEKTEKMLFVGEQVLGRWTNAKEDFGVLGDLVSRNVAYYCVEDLLRVTSLADGLQDAEAVKGEAVRCVLAIAKRMPEGRRMQAPAIVADLAGILVEQKRPKQWILTDWLAELRAYVMEPDKERAYNKLTRLRIMANPMEII